MWHPLRHWLEPLVGNASSWAPWRGHNTGAKPHHRPSLWPQAGTAWRPSCKGTARVCALSRRSGQELRWSVGSTQAQPPRLPAAPEAEPWPLCWGRGHRGWKRQWAGRAALVQGSHRVTPKLCPAQVTPGPNESLASGTQAGACGAASRAPTERGRWTGAARQRQRLMAGLQLCWGSGRLGCPRGLGGCAPLGIPGDPGTESPSQPQSPQELASSTFCHPCH